MQRDSKSLLWDALDAMNTIVAFRNILIHGYAMIDRARVWQAVENELPPLRAALDDVLAGLK